MLYTVRNIIFGTAKHYDLRRKYVKVIVVGQTVCHKQRPTPMTYLHRAFCSECILNF